MLFLKLYAIASTVTEIILIFPYLLLLESSALFTLLARHLVLRGHLLDGVLVAVVLLDTLLAVVALIHCVLLLVTV